MTHTCTYTYTTQIKQKMRSDCFCYLLNDLSCEKDILMANLNGHHYQLQSQGIHYYIHEK